MESSINYVTEKPPASHIQGQITRGGYEMLTEVLGEPLQRLQCEAEITADFFVVFDIFPFAAGGQRLAFKGRLYERRENYEPVFRVPVVVKMEMASADHVSRGQEWRTKVCEEEADIAIRKHDLTRSYMNKWNTLSINKSFYVLSTEKVRITKVCSVSEMDPYRYPVLRPLFERLFLDIVLYVVAVGTVEDYLPGRFVKFLNNDGNSNLTVSANSPSAFAHWTWAESNGEVMISDTQGVRTGTTYILTDPCVHSVRDSEGFGLSDLGMAGIEEFFSKHQCNKLCEDLGLANNGKDLDIGHSLRTRIVTGTEPTERSLKRLCGVKISQQLDKHVHTETKRYSTKNETMQNQESSSERTVYYPEQKLERKMTLRSRKTRRLLREVTDSQEINQVPGEKYGNGIAVVIGIFRRKDQRKP